MKKNIINFIIFFGLLAIFVALCHAGQIPSPPPVKDQELANYLSQIYSNSNNLTIVTSDPNNSRQGTYGDMVIYNNAGTYYFEICTSNPNGKTWKKVTVS